jgi:hypothetical protein
LIEMLGNAGTGLVRTKLPQIMAGINEGNYKCSTAYVFGTISPTREIPKEVAVSSQVNPGGALRWPSELTRGSDKIFSGSDKTPSTPSNEHQRPNIRTA